MKKPIKPTLKRKQIIYKKIDLTFEEVTVEEILEVFKGIPLYAKVQYKCNYDNCDELIIYSNDHKLSEIEYQNDLKQYEIDMEKYKKYRQQKLEAELENLKKEE